MTLAVLLKAVFWLWLSVGNPYAFAGVFEELYLDIPGFTVADLTNAAVFPDAPYSSRIVDDFLELPQSMGGDFGVRWRGLLIAPQSGNYRFWIASDDESALWLSTDETPGGSVVIATVSQWTDPRQWNAQPSQTSPLMPLAAGRHYYFEVLMKQDGGPYNLAVRWQLPNGTIEEPMPASRLIPYAGPVSAPPQIVQQPRDRTATAGRAATFTVGVNNLNLAFYQWQRNDTNLSAQNSSLLVIPVTTLADNASRFRCVVSNPAGGVYSREATLTVVTNPPPAISGVYREVYRNVGGNEISNLTSAGVFPYNPSYASILQENLETPNFANNYGQRFRALVLPPASGNYVFWIASSWQSVLYLSSDETPSKKQPIATVGQWTGPREWNKENNQHSAPVFLSAGQQYYLEALHKAGPGQGHFAVAWQQPGEPPPANGSEPIQAIHLLAYERIESVPPALEVSPAGQSVVRGEPVILTASAVGSVPLAYQWLRNGSPVMSQTNTTLAVPTARAADDGNYAVVVTNEFGSVTSATVRLSVFAPTNVPQFEWVALSEGANIIDPRGVALDQAGNGFVAGRFVDMLGLGGTNVASRGQADFFLAKYDAAGRFQWVRTGGSTNDDYTHDIVADRSGNCYVAGYFDSNGGVPFDFGPTHLIGKGNRDVFLAKYNSAGTLQWVKQIGGFTASDGGADVNAGGGLALDAVGNLYVSGLYHGPASFDGFNLNSRDWAWYIAKYDPAGAVQWARSIGTNGASTLSAMAVDLSGNVYLSGNLYRSMDFGSGVVLVATNGGVFLAKYDSSGALQWARQAGGTEFDYGNALAIDSQGNCYVAGMFSVRAGSVARFGAYRLTAESVDAFLAKYDSAGVCQWVHKGGGPGSGWATGLVFDNQGNPLVIGFYSTVASFDGFTVSGEGQEVFLANYDSSGTIQWAQRAGGPGSDYGAAVAVNEAGVCLIAGNLGGPFFRPVHFGTVMVTNPTTSYQLFLAKLSVSTNSSPVAVLNLEVVGPGTVSQDPDQSFYNLDDIVTLTATPDRYVRFVQWGDGATNNPRQITIGPINHYTAIFSTESPLETLTFGHVSRTAPVGMPAVFVDGEFVVTGVVTRLETAEVTMLTTFSRGLIFYSLDSHEPSFGDQLYTGPFVLRHSATLRAVAYDANFLNTWIADPVQIMIEPTFAVHATTPGGGMVSVSPGGPSYLRDTLVTLTATPQPGWTFLQWLGDVSGTGSVTSVCGRSRDLYAQALFGTTLGITVAGNGAALMDPVVPLYPYGTVVRLTAVPQAGYYFGAWGNAAMSTDNPMLFPVISANSTVSCAFGPLSSGQVALAVLVNGRGRVTANPRGNRFSTNQVVTLTALADVDQEFLGWNGAISGTSTNLTVILTESKMITAKFTSRPRLSLSLSLGGCQEESLQLQLTGQIGGRYRIEHASELANWSELGSFTNTYGILQVIDTVTNDARRFYRALEER